MARTLSDNRVKVVTSTKPNGTAVFAGLNGSAPAGGYINPEAMHDPTTGVVIATNDLVPYCAFVDNLFETGIGTIDMSAHTLTRPSTIISNSSGTTSRIDFSGASANPTLICSWDAILGQSSYNLMRNGIYGLELSAPSNVTLASSAGCAWIEGLGGAPLAAAALATITPTLAANTFYNVFEFMSSGVITLEAISGGAAGATNPPVAFAVPAGSARSKTSDTSRRFLGSVLTDGSSHIRPFRMTDMGGGIAESMYLADAGAAAPFLLLAAGHATSYTAVDMSSLIPNNGTACEALLSWQSTAATGSAPNPTLFLSLDGTGYSYFIQNPVPTTSTLTASAWVPINAATTAAIYYKLDQASATAALFCWGYRFRR